MQSRKVHFAKIDIKGEYKFSDILLSKGVDKFITKYNNKDLEVSHIEDEGDYITGVFVATQLTDIPPTHKPGDDEDYSAVMLEDGKGFAYPNIFLYCKKNNVLCYEVNRYGFSQKVIEFYFNMFSTSECKDEFRFEMGLVLNIDPVKRAQQLTRINEIEIQIANPLNYIESHISENGSFKQIAEISKNMNATKAISLRLMASDDKTKRLSLKNAINMLKAFRLLPHSSSERTKDKLIIKGETETDDDTVIDDVINVMINSLEGWFKLRRQKIAHSLQIEERKEGITTVYKKFKKDITELT